MKELYSDKKFWVTLLGLDIIGVILAYFFAGTLKYDEFEHLRASFLVSQGYLPYNDFFEHHHPLIWFLFAPIIAVLPHNIITALLVAKFMSAIFSAATLWVIYLIILRFMGGKKTAIYAALIYFSIYISWYMFSTFKPDVFMHFFYFSGLYYFFAYYEKQQTKDLCLCGICLTISFIFLQTALFLILPLVVAFLYMIYKNHRCIVDALKVAIIPLGRLALCVAVLVKVGLWENYWQQNWIYNKYLFQTMVYTHLISYEYCYCYILATIAAYIWLLKNKKTSFYLNTIMMIAFVWIIRMIIYTPYFPHYFTLLGFCEAILIAQIIPNINLLVKKYIKMFLVMMLLVNTTIFYLDNNSTITANAREVQGKSFFNVNADNLDIYAPIDRFCYLKSEICAVDDIIFDRQPDFDINKYVRNNKFEYIAYFPPLNVLNDNLPKDFHINKWNNYQLDENILLNDYKQVRRFFFQRKDK